MSDNPNLISSVFVRKAAIADLPELARLFDAYRVFYEQASDVNAARVFLQERLSQADAVLFVAVSVREDQAELNTGEPVGFAQLYPSFSSVGMRRMWILNDLFVANEFRKKGVARLLMAACEGFAKETGARGLSLRTAKDNLTAQSLYVSRGWIQDTKFLTYTLNF